MPAQTAGVVVIGSGAFGASTAYHLARRGADVVLLDQHALGLPDLAAGGGAHEQGRQHAGDGAAARRGLRGARALRIDHGPVGRLSPLRQPQGGLHRGRRGAAPPGARHREEARHRGGARLARPRREQLAPHFKPGRARAIGYVPSDGWLDPAKVASGFIARATELGARMMPFTPARELLQVDGRVVGVATPRGDIGAPVVVDAAGAWTARVAAAAGIALPLVPVRHQLFITEPIAGRRAAAARRAPARGERLRAPRAGRAALRRLRGPARA